MQYLVKALGQHTTQRVHLSTLSASDGIKQGSVVAVRLPTSGFVDLHSFAMFFTGTPTTTA
eukprot:7862097-Lingulodinium_polyedra.AAC.1